MKALDIRERLESEKGNYAQDAYTASLQQVEGSIEEIKQHLLDDNMVVKKGTDPLTVKIYPNP